MAGSSKKPILPHWQKITIERFKDIKDHPDFDEDIEALLKLLNITDLSVAIDNARRVMGLAPGLSDSSLIRQNLYRMIKKYEAPRGMFELLRSYILYLQDVKEDGEKKLSDSELLSLLPETLKFPPMFVACSADNSVLMSDDSPLNAQLYNTLNSDPRHKRVIIELTADVQQQDLIDFIKQNYGYIEKKLELVDPNRIKRATSKQQLKRDYKIIRLYKQFFSDPKYKGKVHESIYKEMNSRQELASSDIIMKVIKHYKKQNKQWGLIFSDKTN